ALPRHDPRALDLLEGSLALGGREVKLDGGRVALAAALVAGRSDAGHGHAAAHLAVGLGRDRDLEDRRRQPLDEERVVARLLAAGAELGDAELAGQLAAELGGVADAARFADGHRERPLDGLLRPEAAPDERRGVLAEVLGLGLGLEDARAE